MTGTSSALRLVYNDVSKRHSQSSVIRPIGGEDRVGKLVKLIVRGPLPSL